ncbi:MAG: alpha/beta hydrolase [Leptothrix sp. (in: Bacteria)]|nr:alpha/beta hydrolase [Leptothrix sp. (in: b-proteobacteria)]
MSVPRWRRRLVGAAAGAAALYGAAIALLWWRQEGLLFHPRALPAEHRFEQHADVHEVWVDVPGARLNALHLRLPQPDGVVFFLHGNAGNLASWFVNTGYYRRLNLDLFMIDYRGFGKSSGRIDSEEGLHADVRAAWAQVAPRYAGRKRVIYGRSLGSGLAAALAAEVQPELTVLVSPFASMAALAGEVYPWVPGAVLRYPLRTDAALPRVQGRVLLVHGLRDTLVPPSHSERLRKVMPRAEWLPVPEAGHGNIDDDAVYLDGLAAALAR